MARIQTIADIHELLYQSDSFSRLNFDENLENILSKIRDTFEVDSQIDIDLNLDPVKLNVTQAIPCSLIINEVFTNALKHAYPNGENGSVQVWLKEEDEKIELSIKDDGIGLPENMESKNSSLGYQLIKTLVKQLNAKYRYQSCSQGTEFRLEFSKEK